MTGKRLRLNLAVDERTAELDDEALYCRSYGHKWGLRPMSEARLRETLRNGFIENNRFCENGCGGEWSETLDASTFETVTVKRVYPKNGYLLKNGSGRLPRHEAKKTRFVRQWPQFA